MILTVLLLFSLSVEQGNLPSLEKAYQEDPNNYANAYNLALAYLQLQSIDKSRAIVEQLLKHGDNAELHNLLGDIEETAGHVDEAARQFELAARMDPSEKNLFDLGDDLLKHSGFKPALTVFDFGAKRFPNSARLRVGLGVSYYSVGQYDDAVRTLCEAVDLDPRDTKALDFLGKMHDISPQYAVEVSHRLAAFATHYPDNAAAQYYYGLSLRKTDDRGAETCLQRAVQLKPAFTDGHYELGLLYQDLQDDQKAIDQFTIVIKQRPTFLQAHYHLARLYQKNHKDDLAQREFATIHRLKASAAP